MLQKNELCLVLTVSRVVCLLTLWDGLEEDCPEGGKSDFHTHCLPVANSLLRTCILQCAVSFIKGIFGFQWQTALSLERRRGIGSALLVRKHSARIWLLEQLLVIQVRINAEVVSLFFFFPLGGFEVLAKHGPLLEKSSNDLSLTAFRVLSTSSPFSCEISSFQNVAGLIFKFYSMGFHSSCCAWNFKN